jgi:hypothetical protein
MEYIMKKIYDDNKEIMEKVKWKLLSEKSMVGDM